MWNPSLNQIINKLKICISSWRIGKNKKKRRSDAINTTIIRSVNKIPKLLLKIFITKNQYKSNNINHVYEDYKRCFNEGFVPLLTQYLGTINYSDQSLFIDFIKLSFPVNKVIKIINDFLNEPLDRIQFIEQSRKSSMKSIKNNKAFCLICKAILHIIHKEKIGLSEEFYVVLQKIICY